MAKFKKLLVSLFIVMNFMMMIRAQLKDNSPVISFIYTPVTYIQNALSMWRGWSMFAPNPLRINGFLDAKIVYTDGSEMIWTFPRPQEGSLVQRYMYGERYRKYTMDGLRLDSKKFLWKDGARFVLRKTAKLHNGKRPEKVILRRRFKTIKNWNKKFVKHNMEIPKNEYNTYEFYTLRIKKI